MYNKNFLRKTTEARLLSQITTVGLDFWKALFKVFGRNRKSKDSEV